MDAIQFGLLGLGIGAMYALVAQGLVLIYRGSGVVNFAHGATAGVGAYSYYELQRHSWAVVPSVLLGVVAAALVGLLIQVFLMRPLRSASPLTRLIATIGVLTVLVEIGSIRYGADPAFVSPILGTARLTLPHGLTIGVDRVWLVVIAVVVTAVLWLVYRFTRFGLMTTATAENERTASSLGISPDRLALVNWTAGSGLAGLAGVLLAPVISLSVSQSALIVIAALGAALIGRFVSFPLTLLGGLVVGVAQSEMANYVTTPGWSDSAPFLVIIAIMVLRGRALPLRGHLIERLPSIGNGMLRPLVFVPALAASLALIWTTPDAWVESVTTTFIFATICLSVVLLTGYAGQLSLAQFALAGFGAFAAGRLADALSLPFSLAAVLGVLLTVPVGLVLALPALRTRGVNLAIVTLGLAVAIQKLVLENSSYTGGYAGTTVGPPKILGFTLDDSQYPSRYATFALIVFTLLALMVRNIRRGRVGRRMVAVRSNERAAAALGVNVVGAKLYAFAVAAGIAGAGGTLIAFRSTSVTFTQYDPLGSINVVVLAVLGGVGYISGAVVAGLFAQGGLLTQLGDVILNVNPYMGLIAGLVLLVNLVVYPNGIASRVPKVVSELRAPDHRRTRPAPDELLEPALDGGVAGPRADLDVRSVSVQFGGVKALRDVSFSLQTGEVVGIIGPNGAGKTTLLDVLSGFAPGHRGTVRLNDVDISRWSAARRARAGIGRSFQSLELFDDLSVRENMLVACDDRDRRSYLIDLFRPRSTTLTRAAVVAVAEFGLAEQLDSKTQDLSAGQRRLVGIARAVAAQPSILLLDEPAAGLDENETRELGRLITALATRLGLGILVVEHDLALVMTVCDRIVVLDSGACIASGPPTQIRSDEAVIAAYLGTDADSDGVVNQNTEDGLSELAAHRDGVA